MPRSSAVSIENNFVGGLKTDFSGLNFPENACTETFNCIFDRTGIVYRRFGLDLELASTTATIDRTNVAVNNYLWKNVAGDGNTTLAVVQIGGTLHFYNSSVGSGTLSANKLATTIALGPFGSGGVDIPSNECQFSDGNGYLFVTHPGLEPFYVDYNAGAPTGTAITIQVRDFKGILGEIDTVRPTSITATHRYNLGNQGWTSGWLAQSATSITIGTGSKAFTVAQSADVGAQVGDRVRVYSRATPGSLGPSTNSGNIMIGTVTAFAAGVVTVNVTSTNGAGTLTDWNIVAEPDNLDAWSVVFSNYPSNCDVWWLYKNTTDVFAPSTEYLNKLPGNTPATKGHYILSAFNEDRAVAAGILGLATSTTSGARPTTSAFHQGRVFYAGVQAQGFNSKIYFTQIIERTDQFGKCYQVEDPASEVTFDLLPSDGGVIQIQGAGTIIKLVAIQGALIVFANNGIWSITGNQGIGFTATDYTIGKISSIIALSATSFVDVGGYPMFWAEDGIYLVALSGNGLGVQSITAGSTSAFYAEIPLSSKKLARGAYNYVNFTVQWAFKTTESADATAAYSFDGVLNFNTLTQSMFPWIIGAGLPTLNGVFVTSSQGGTQTINQVTSASGANNVQDGAGNNVVTYSIAGATSVTSTFKYLISYANAGSYKISFAEHYKTSYLDWETTNVGGVNYTSYFISGYKVHGDAQRKFQANYIYLFSINDEPTGYIIQGIWSFANSQASGAFTTQQRTTSPEIIGLDGTNFALAFRRHKIRGTGLAYQTKVTSIQGLPFKIAGWSIWETGNSHV